MSSEIETSLDISGSRRIQRFHDSARNDRHEDSRQCLFSLLDVYHNGVAHSAAMNMAIDEALLESAAGPSVRFYRWQSPALSFGYFGNFSDVAIYDGERDLVRRWTGGGMVLHGDDLTYSIVIPLHNAALAESSLAIYERIHRALAEALNGIGERAEVVGSTRCADRPLHGVATNNCFANPVRADVMVNGRKIAGAAQRRTRRGLLHQGSIQSITLENDLAQRFARGLSADCSERQLERKILERARELAQQKYGTDSWLRKR